MSPRSAMPVFELLALFVVVYALQLVGTFAGVVEELFVLQPPVLDNPWTVVTSVFAHAGPEHLVSNAVGLVMFGIPVALFTTRTRFHAFFLTAGALAGVSQILLSDLLSDLLSILPVIGLSVTPSPGVLGASGGVFALLGYLLTGNRLAKGVGEVVDVPRWLTYLVFFALAAVITVVTATDGAALIAHFVGLLVGLLAGWLNLLNPRQ